jgi:hypothetical protein
MRPALISLFTLLCVQSGAQHWVTVSNADSTLVMIKDDRFDAVVERVRQDNLDHPTVPGYRVQIYFGSNRQKASEVKLDFVSRYGDMAAYLTYQQPNYKVRVGDFHTRYEAFQFLKKIEGLYPTTFVVPDEVKLPPLK